MRTCPPAPSGVIIDDLRVEQAMRVGSVLAAVLGLMGLAGACGGHGLRSGPDGAAPPADGEAPGPDSSDASAPETSTPLRGQSSFVVNASLLFEGDTGVGAPGSHAFTLVLDASNGVATVGASGRTGKLHFQPGQGVNFNLEGPAHLRARGHLRRQDIYLRSYARDLVAPGQSHRRDPGNRSGSHTRTSCGRSP